jgi:hypothetical protein
VQPTRTPAWPRRARRPIVAAAILMFALGTITSAARAQFSSEDRRIPTGPAEATRDVPPITDPEWTSSAPPVSPRVGPWRSWSRTPIYGGPEGSTRDGMPYYRHDGGRCWPHGDHFHCR